MVYLFASRTRGAYDLLTHAVAVAGLPARPAIARTVLGKPYFPAVPRLHFSLSHSGPLALCALADAPVGVDIERVRPRRAGLPRRVLRHEEFAAWQGAGGTWADFYGHWTRKEAVVKYTGQGLRTSLRDIAVPEGAFGNSYAGEGWRAYVCADERPPDDIIWLD